LETTSRTNSSKPLKKHHKEKATPQLSLFGQKPEVLEELEKLDINALTPLEALNKLYELQKKAGK
ncbi:MAG: hypothetical protein PHE15_04900, partial [Dehalococcoidales bacterium]|nr:hypothetical protein [Dehalococcoidales bacterium]